MWDALTRIYHNVPIHKEQEQLNLIDTTYNVYNIVHAIHINNVLCHCTPSMQWSSTVHSIWLSNKVLGYILYYICYHTCRYIQIPIACIKICRLTWLCFSSVGKLHPQSPQWAGLQELLPPHHQRGDQLQWHCCSYCIQGGLFRLHLQWCWSHCLQLGCCSHIRIQLQVEWQTLCTQD